MSIFMMYVFVLFFFFSSRRRHTRCGRDWSSDVCSSDLETFYNQSAAARHLGIDRKLLARKIKRYGIRMPATQGGRSAGRSEERRVGKECRARWSRDHEKKKIYIVRMEWMSGEMRRSVGG